MTGTPKRLEPSATLALLANFQQSSALARRGLAAAYVTPALTPILSLSDPQTGVRSYGRAAGHL
jgi:hypothetical protein